MKITIEESRPGELAERNPVDIIGAVERMIGDELRKGLPTRGGELEVIDQLAAHMGAAYAEMMQRLSDHVSRRGR